MADRDVLERIAVALEKIADSSVLATDVMGRPRPRMVVRVEVGPDVREAIADAVEALQSMAFPPPSDVDGNGNPR